ncbi:HAD-IIIA family hydrolase [Rhodococcus sp. SGAir0479]|uniref:HAD-IIIA family hydrolase n=1 Tax=Rhodococcus sp. SGAir0479 TaxID=2567884 RepID=UPI0010CCE92C|nr:HAD-IIIA family hydrolase [Rhodococcus sp. SGAir0479]QCQ91357.1 HAD-IIIA family hydrolase [Rhodococcus sp. SGAir0479]
MTDPSYTIVVPTVLRPSLHTLLAALARTAGPRPSEIVVVVDRPAAGPHGGPESECGAVPVRWLSSGGRGPAAARNRGWRVARDPWVVFLDDDVVVPHDWARRLAADLRPLGPEVAASYARIDVPAPVGRRPTDDERRTLSLQTARWITADAAVRRSALLAVGGFDERFPRAYREDADLALRLMAAGFTLTDGARVTRHPVGATRVLSSVRAQAGNADNALMRHRHGRGWRRRAGDGPGRSGRHAATTAVAAIALGAAATGRRRTLAIASTVWLAAVAQFAVRRIAPGPRTAREVAAMVATSALIPPVAVWHRLRGEVGVLRGGTVVRSPVLAVLFDRDDTLIHDVPYLADHRAVQPVPGAHDVLARLRADGILVGVVTNQSGVATGRITVDQLRAVNDEVERRLGRFDTWQICTHADGGRCSCRKPLPGLVLRAAADLGVPPESCLMIGDTGADVEAARAAGAVGVLVPTARTLGREVVRARAAGALADNLAAAVAVIGLGRDGTTDR